MSNSYLKLFKSSTLYVVLGFLPLGINFLLAPLYTEILPPEEYALIFLTNLVQGFIVIFVGVGLETAFSRYYFQYYTRRKLMLSLLSTVLVAVCCIGLVIGGILYIVGDPLLDWVIKNENFSYSGYGFYGFVSAWTTVIQAFFLAYYRNEEKPLAFAATSLTFFVTSVAGILIGILYFDAMAFGSVAGRAAGKSIVALVLLILFWSKNPFVFRWSLLKRLFIFGFPIALYQLLMAAFNNVDRIMVDQFFEEAILGQYGFAFLLASTIAVLISSIFNAVAPRIYKLLEEDRTAFIGEIRNMLQAFLLVLQGFIVIGIALIYPFMHLFIKESYHPSIEYAGLLFMAYLPYCYYVIYTIPILFHKKTKDLPWVSLGALLVGIGANLTLIPWLGIWGVGIALLLIRSVQLVITYFLLKRYGMAREAYLHMPKSHIISVSILLFYVGLLIFWKMTGFVGIGVINVLPVLLYSFLIFLFFRSQLATLWTQVKGYVMPAKKESE